MIETVSNFSKILSINSWFILLSSATKMVFPLNKTLSFLLSFFFSVINGSVCFSKDSCTLNSEPILILLVTCISPPINAISFFTIANPSPVPLWLRENELSICSKRSKILPRSFSGIPIPVSVTQKFRSKDVSVSLVTVVIRDTVPALVNFMALPIKFTNICFTLSASPNKAVLIFLSVTIFNVKPFSAASVSNIICNSFSSLFKLKKSFLIGSESDSILEKSSISFTIVNKFSLAV